MHESWQLELRLRTETGAALSREREQELIEVWNRVGAAQS